ncbi:phosphoglucosamine mutase [Sediminicurvatus halobius]|uniref:Phosphoglucosamine mutase n=1 Tax=Sediminicurvatus halobius TaxID=2182432 RepID=A0A2U2N4N7_9GAMM|nr:phosphoglucosamine mutase [Spiribacter halobius]PWG64080.1 phosphoglucosamine mutase [Spiribacter halobius]UEX76866.1 phosphoglucosamine mutase [Spiribacter halobius]
MQKRYFGTDGIRGRVGESPITADFVLKLGWAAGRVLSGRGTNNQVLIGKDTRLSNYMFESALEAGLSAAGVNIQLLGPMPTPATAYLTRTLQANAGIVISASHNPHQDNGIKFFSAEGRKLDDDTELAIEALLDEPLTTVASERLGKAFRLVDAPGRYIEFCKHSLRPGRSLEGLRLVVDCANGAGYQVAPAVFHELGAEVIRLGVQPDGLNINVDCGSMHPEAMRQAVLEHRADAGIALDGDGDRVLMVDEKGRLLDGDELLWVIARDRHDGDGLAGPVVGTQMTNLGLELALQRLKVPFLRARVGDRYVLEMLLANGGTLGGESSGHIVCLDRTTTGDGVVSALQVLGRAVAVGRPLSELVDGMEKLPQHMVNVPVAQRRDPLETAAVVEAVNDVEHALGEAGRVLLRPSGTEPVVRVMVEGRDEAAVRRHAAALAEVVREALSASPA